MSYNADCEGGSAQPDPAERESHTVVLLEQARLTGDTAAAKGLRAEAVEVNVAWATGIARRYVGRGVDIDDLQQVALLGLVLAVERFDPHEGSFTPYARATIHGELKRHLRDYAWTVRPPRALHDRYLEIQRTTHNLTQKLGRIPREDEIAESLGMTTAQVREARAVAGSYAATSLEALTADRPDAFTGEGLNLGVMGTIEERLAALSLREIIKTLQPRDRLIVQLRFGQDLTQRQIGQRLGISQMQVSRLLAAVMRRLRDTLAGDTAQAS
ncbi:sigma-70 family RNA polymerase sigma factor [Allobranchiibius sp. CTAmp26]|uniref:sigma-70 family RNA polymerase sigma factor n=1 Tax=Allobranchiibius sp. CTAmp26 TaxID=2815214 RepID=UPI001AA18DAA|nr:sigma-70 family RNA polymerase sigma factor [Allobranchiibius sp. CTAmp26]MBO1756521.1 sigma-70 family RNA polymerase sigma factor [Allobranchiibius sp. CTAmp26]